MVTANTQLIGDTMRLGLSLLLALWVGVASLDHVQAQDPPAKPPTDGDASANKTEDDAKSESHQYQQLEFKDLKSLSTDVGRMRTAGQFESGDQQKFESFYLEYLLPRWTDPGAASSLPSYRKELRAQLAGTKKPAHDVLAKIVFDFMAKLANGPYDPVVQVNAILMMGDLNDAESANLSEIKPFSNALKTLCSMVEDPQRPAAMRAAAMVGIMRHAAVGIADEEAKKSLIDSMMKQMAADMPSGSAESGEDWLRCQAIETLSSLGSVGENNTIFKTILDSAINHSRSHAFGARCIAMASLGRLNYANAEGIDIADTLNKSGKFILNVCKDELQVAEETGSPIARRRIVQCLNAVRTAWTGESKERNLASLAKDSEKRRLNGLLDIIDKTIPDVSDKKTDADTIIMTVQDLQISMEDWLKAE